MASSFAFAFGTRDPHHSVDEMLGPEAEWKRDDSLGELN